jgi:hypothetical protein
MAQDPDMPVDIAQLEITVFGRQPPVDDLRDLNRTPVEQYPSRLLLATVASVAFDLDVNMRIGHCPYLVAGTALRNPDPAANERLLATVKQRRLIGQ